MSVIWRLENNNLIHDNLAAKLEDFFYEPFPKHFWDWNDRLETELLPETLDSFWYEPILPITWNWGDRLETDLLADSLKTFYYQPTLPFMWYYNENNKLTQQLLLPPPQLGAFCEASNLKTIKIPSTCEKIGEFSFTNTQLKNVVLPDNCSYYSTSFPEDCIVIGGFLIE